jgi:hypothetical protein
VVVVVQRRTMAIFVAMRRRQCHTTPSPHTAMSETDDFFSPRFENTFRESSNLSHCEGGWPWLKKTDNIFISEEETNHILCPRHNIILSTIPTSKKHHGHFILFDQKAVVDLRFSFSRTSQMLCLVDKHEN